MSTYVKPLVGWSTVAGDAATEMRRQVVLYVDRVRGGVKQRVTAVTRRQIVEWFHATPALFVLAAVDEAVRRGEVERLVVSVARPPRPAKNPYYVTTTAGRALACGVLEDERAMKLQRSEVRRGRQT
jgi:hypothetical protein